MASQAGFSPLRRIDGYLPLEDHGLIGDGSTAALVGRDGSIPWLCVPRFDSPALFARILDSERGGALTVAPDEIVEARQHYVPDSGVLVTEMRSPTGLLRVTDALTLRADADLSEGLPAARGELLRLVEVVEGHVTVHIALRPHAPVVVDTRAGGLRLRVDSLPGLDLQLVSPAGLDSPHSVHDLRAGETTHVLLRWGGGVHRYTPTDPNKLLHDTLDCWQRWIRCFSYDGPQTELVRRSAITLKLLDHFQNGAIVAAPTSSLPEAIGGPRNWDYRYAWVRDAGFSVYALRRIGLQDEAWAFLGWVLDACERDGHPKVLYDLDGRQPPQERIDHTLEGYRRSPPVRWGNAAADQQQNDAFGEILDCAWQWAAGGGTIDEALWKLLGAFVEDARRLWRTPDHGIWEVRTPGRTFTYSAALCQVALDRGARLAERFGLEGDIAGWRAEADKIRDAILTEAWDDQVRSLTEHLGGGGLDASLLSLPLRRVIPAGHPAMVATTEAVTKRLGAGNGLVYRYLPDESPDGLPGDEGAFLLCSFWLVDNLAYQGRLDEALELYDSLCARANPLGLLPEQIDAQTDEFLGNFPQAFSHVGVISSGVVLSNQLKNR